LVVVQLRTDYGVGTALGIGIHRPVREEREVVQIKRGEGGGEEVFLVSRTQVKVGVLGLAARSGFRVHRFEQGRRI
jgi:hypothetical protein